MLNCISILCSFLWFCSMRLYVCITVFFYSSMGSYWVLSCLGLYRGGWKCSEHQGTCLFSLVMVFSEYMPSNGIVGSYALGIEMETRWIHILVFRKYYPEESLEKMSKILSDILTFAYRSPVFLCSVFPTCFKVCKHAKGIWNTSLLSWGLFFF